MTAAAEPSASWLKSRNDLLQALVKTEDKTVLPHFPQALCERMLKDKFRLEDVSIRIQARGVLSSEQVLQEVGNRMIVQDFLAQPLQPSSFFFVTSEEDLQAFMVAVFNDTSLASYFYEKDRLLGFHYYYCTELCRLLQELSWLPSISLKVGRETHFSGQPLQGSYHVVDVMSRFDGTVMHFRMLFSEALCESCYALLSSTNQSIDVQKLGPLSIGVSIEVGYCQLTQEEWAQVVPGSFISLDSCLYDPDTEESGGLLVVQGKKVFGGRFLDVKSGDFKITSYPNLQEEEMHTEEEAKATPPPGHKLIAEVARYTLTVEEFLKLSQGSVLNFNGVHPSRGIHIILDGAKVGRGEIVSLGDVLGIRVLEV